MPTVIQHPTTGSDATYSLSGTRVALDVDIGSGVVINIGSVSAQVDSVYVQSGNVAITEEVPTAANKNNPAWRFSYITSGTDGLTGSAVSEIVQFIGTGSYVQTLTYADGVISGLGSWL